MVLTKHPRITIGMLTKNGAWCLDRVLEAVFNTDYPRDRIQIVVVDDFSTDGSWQILQNWKASNIELYDGIELVQKRTNIPEARNVCLAHATGDYVLFWDSDVIPPTNTLLQDMMKEMEENLDIGAVGCSYIYENPTLLMRAKKSPVSMDTHAVFLGFTLIRSNIFKDIGGFNERMSVGEDTEFFIRVRERTKLSVRWGPRTVLHLRSEKGTTSGPTKFSKWIRYTYRDRAKGYFKELRNIPLFLRLRVVYYLSLPLFWLFVLIIAAFGMMDALVAVLLLILSIVPALAFAVRNSGLRDGLITAITFYIPTGIALSYGVLREAIHSSLGSSQ